MKAAVSLFAMSLLTAALIVATPSIAHAQELQICADDPGAPLDVALLLDRSGSVDDADPDGLRFDAASAFVDGLADLGATGRPVAINVMLFNTAVDQSGWIPLDGPQAADSVNQLVADAWERPTGDTDHVVAFDEALLSLDERTGHCRVAVMFTDGVMDTGRSQEAVADDIGRALGHAAPCSPRPEAAFQIADSLSERSVELGVTTFVLLLDPKPGAIAFQERLDATMTLFAGVTGEGNPPALTSPYSIACRSTLSGQSGRILSAADINLLLAHFYRIESEVSGGVPAIESCPASFSSGTQPLPAGSLINQLIIISFDSADGGRLEIGDFVAVTGNQRIPADEVFTVEDGNAVRLRASVADPARLTGGWTLEAPDARDYCVQLFAEPDLRAHLAFVDDPLLVSEDGETADLMVVYSPEELLGEVRLDAVFEGLELSTTSETAGVPASLGWVEEGPTATDGRVSALRTELFQDLPIELDVASPTVWDFSAASLPLVECAGDSVVIASGEVPDSGSTAVVPTGCTVQPGSQTDGLETWLQVTATSELPGRTRLVFELLTEGGTQLIDQGTPLVITYTGEILAGLADLPNDWIETGAILEFEVFYGSLDHAVGSESQRLEVDLAARSNTLVATIVTIIATMLLAILSLLLLWLFNRWTARLPTANRFFFQRIDPSQVSDGHEMKPVRQRGSSLVLDDIEIELRHPPIWKPFSSSIGVLKARGPAASDPAGPAEGTIPVGFSWLLIAVRTPDGLEFTAVVPRSGPRSGMDGIAWMATDRSRFRRLEDRLSKVPKDAAQRSSHPPAPADSPSPTDPNSSNGSQTDEPPTPFPKEGPTLPG